MERNGLGFVGAMTVRIFKIGEEKPTGLSVITRERD